MSIDDMVNIAAKAEQTASTYPETHREVAKYLAVFDGMSSFSGVEGVGSYEGLVLKYGQQWMWAPRPEGTGQGTMKECYSNAYSLATERDWLYVEGYAQSSLGLAVQHAWCVDPETNQVIDPTWQNAGAYLGIVMDLQFVSDLIVKQGYYGVLGNDWINDSQIIQRGFVWDVDERSQLSIAIGIGEP